MRNSMIKFLTVITLASATAFAADNIPADQIPSALVDACNIYDSRQQRPQEFEEKAIAGAQALNNPKFFSLNNFGFLDSLVSAFYSVNQRPKEWIRACLTEVRNVAKGVNVRPSSIAPTTSPTIPSGNSPVSATVLK
jgi:hypothetical protein